MWPYLFRIGEIPVRNYALILILSMVGLALFGARRLRKQGGDAAVAVDAAIIYILSITLLAHIAYCYISHGFTLQAHQEFFNFTDGGLWGGQVFLIAGLVVYTLIRRFPLGLTLDLMAPAILLCLGISKIACLLSGCCWGEATDSIFGLTLHPDCDLDSRRMPLHAVPLYDALWAGAGLCILLFMERKPKPPGSLFLAFLTLYASGRFLTEFMRYDYTGQTGILGIYTSQWVELGCVLVTLMFWIWIHRRHQAQSCARLIKDQPLPGNVSPGSYTKRCFAYLIDSIPTCVLAGLALTVHGRLQWFLWCLVGLVYFVIFALLPRTPGQAIFGLITADKKGGHATILRRWFRSLLIPLSLGSIVGVFRPLASSSRQMFHDMMTQTHVAERKGR